MQINLSRCALFHMKTTVSLRYFVSYCRYLTSSQTFLNQKFRKKFYFLFTHSYINYGNIAQESRSKNKSKKILTNQKKAAE